MLAFLIISTTIINLISSISICDLKSCVCNYENVFNQDYLGETIQCLYSDTNLISNNYSLPDLAHTLDLSSNYISRLQATPLLKSTTMVELLLINNEITDISVNSFELPRLKRLDLSKNLLTFIDQETFRGLKNLEYLNLADNKFTTFTNLMFSHLSSLNEIVLDNNDVGRSLRRENLFDRSGYGLTRKIQKISLSSINLNKVPDNFFVDANDIRKLVMTNNHLTDIFELPCSLEYLDLSDNPISEISGEDFECLPALKVLKLNNIKISEVPEYVFEPLHSIKTLELSRNKNLTQFSTLAFGNDVLGDVIEFPLERLSLKGSTLTKLDSALLELFGRLVQLDLQGNPWVCDCQITWVKELQIPPRFTEHFRCGSPTQLFNAKIFELNNKYFTCERNKHYIGIIVSLVTVGLIIVLISVWIFWLSPKHNITRGSILRDIYAPTAAYSAIPMASGYPD